jgi:hypothetical protein
MQNMGKEGILKLLRVLSGVFSIEGEGREL